MKIPEEKNKENLLLVYLLLKKQERCGRSPSHMKKENRFWKREHNERKKNEKETKIIITKGDIVIICDDGCVSLAG